MYLALGIIFLVLSLIVLGLMTYLFIRTIIVDKELVSKKNLLYLIPSFLLGYSLYIIAAVSSGINLDFFYCLSLINKALDLFVFKPETNLILGIAKQYPIFYADFIIVEILCSATAILSFVSFFSQRLKNFVSQKKLFRHSCDIVVGVSHMGLKYVRTNSNSILWGTNIGKSEYADLIKSGTVVFRSKLDAKYLLHKLKKGKEYHIIAFCDSNQSYLELINFFSLIKKKYDGTLFIHLEVQTDEIKVINEKFIAKTEQSVGAYITCFNKYELLARKFVFEYPMSKYLPRSFYLDNCAIKESKQLNVVFVGFGKVNYRLFCMTAMQFQFAECVDGRLSSKPVHYYVIDNNENSMHNENFSKILYEINEKFKGCDFEKPDKICDLITPKKIDANSVEAKEVFKKIVNEDSYTYFIISLDDDLVDSAYAQTIRKLLADEENYQIFVRTKNGNCSKLNESDDGIVYFGDEKDAYSRDSIVNEHLTELAMRINLLYNDTTESANWSSMTVQSESKRRAILERFKEAQNRKIMVEEWGKLDVDQQFSNIYHALNIPFKLGLLGFGLSKQDENCTRVITKEEYFDKYVNPCINSGYNNYSFYFETYSSNVLAFIEHARWNAYYLLSDYSQMSKNTLLSRQYVNEYGQTDFKRRDCSQKLHACLTTYHGLNEIILFLFSKLYPDEQKTIRELNSDGRLLALSAIYNYDYMTLDALYDRLLTIGLLVVDENESK